MWFGSRLRGRPLVQDAALAVVAAVVVTVTSNPAGDDQAGVRELDGRALGLIVVAATSVAVRRRWPAAAVAVAVAATLTFLSLRYPYGPVFLFTGVAVYSAAAWRETRYAVLATVAAMAAHVPWALYLEGDPDGALPGLLGSTAWLGGAAATGVAVRTRREARARSLAEDRRRHAYEERLRIAQEVHDVVGHNLAVISMNAGAALHVLSKQDGGAPPVERSLRAIRESSNGALDELRATLATFTGVLAAPERRRAPGLAGLPDLVAATNVEGLRVRLTQRGRPGRVAAAVDLAGYRIAQEALTNVVRHAAAGHAEVTLEYRSDRLVLTVADDGCGGAPPDPTGTGLASMRERAGAVRGALRAGPRAGGGYEVRAELPYDGAGRSG